jgi:hypothetical protein
MKNLLVVGVICLFLGIAIAPSINANVSKESELIEITTEICGLGGGKHTSYLTEEAAEEVERLFENIRGKLNTTESREEAEKIFKDAVVELDTYGLLGGMSVKQAQKLVTGRYQNTRIIKNFGSMIDRNRNFSNSDLLCLTAGYATNAFIMGPFSFLSLLLLPPIGASLTFILYVFPMAVFGFMVFGDYSVGQHAVYYPAEGWVRTIGLTGLKKWDGKFYGQLLRIDFGLGGEFLGGIGFTGLRIHYGFFNTLFLGSALLMKIGPKHP